MSLDPNQEKLRVTLDDLSTVDTGIAQAATEIAPASGLGRVSLQASRRV